MRLRLLNALVYAVLATFGAAALAGRLVQSFTAAVEPWSYLPGLRLPALWLSLAALLSLLVFLAARRLVLGVATGLRLYAALLLTTGLCVSATRLVPPARRAPANELLDHLVARVERTADAGWERDRRYPTEVSAYEADLPDALREAGFRARPGRLLRSRVHVVPAAAGPVLAAPDGVNPGDVVVAVDTDRRRYWITAFTLDARGRRRPLASGGRVLVAAGVEGRASAQQDPLFPDYPRKSSGARPSASGDSVKSPPDAGAEPTPGPDGATAP